MHPLAVIPHSLLPLASGNRNLIYVDKDLLVRNISYKWYHMWAFVSGFFHLAQYFKVPSMLQHTSVLNSFLWKHNIPHCLPFHHSYTCVVSTSWLLLIILLWHLCANFSVNMYFQFSWVYSQTKVYSLFLYRFCLPLKRMNFWFH